MQAVLFDLGRSLLVPYRLILSIRISESILYVRKLDVFKSHIFFIPTFKENGIFMLGVVLFVQSILDDQNNNFQRKVFMPH